MKTALNVFYIKKLTSYLSKGVADSCLFTADAGPFHGITKKKIYFNNALEQSRDTQYKTINFCSYFLQIQSPEISEKSFKSTLFLHCFYSPLKSR